MEKFTCKAVLLTAPSKVMTIDSTGSKYQLSTARVLNGHLKGSIVPAKNTILNSKGETKASATKGDEVTLHVELGDNGENKKLFFEISPFVENTSDEAMLALLGIEAEVEEEI